MIYQDLLEEIKQMPVIDTHEHFEKYTDTFGYTMPQFFYNCSCTSVFSGDMNKQDVELLESQTADEKDQFHALLRVKQKVRYTNSGRSMDCIAQKLGYELKEENYENLSLMFHTRSASHIRTFAPNIESYICNSVGHPMYGGIRGMKNILNHKIMPDEKMHRVLNITDMHCVDTKEKLADLEYTAGCTIRSLQEWEAACKKIIDSFIKLGIVGYKELYFYFRPMQLELPDKQKAEKEFAALLNGEKAGTALMDYMMFRVYELVSETGLPVAVHTGGLLDTAVTAKDFYQYQKIIQAFPNTTFDLLHLNYPMLEDYMVVLKSCPNTYANAAWITTTNTEYCLNFMKQVLNHISAERVNIFGGDRAIAGEAVEVALEQTQELLAEGLDQMVTRRQLNQTEALEIARLWLYENPKRLYKI